MRFKAMVALFFFLAADLCGQLVLAQLRRVRQEQAKKEGVDLRLPAKLESKLADLELVAGELKWHPNHTHLRAMAGDLYTQTEQLFRALCGRRTDRDWPPHVEPWEDTFDARFDLVKDALVSATILPSAEASR